MLEKGTVKARKSKKVRKFKEKKFENLEGSKYKDQLKSLFATQVIGNPTTHPTTETRLADPSETHAVRCCSDADIGWNKDAGCSVWGGSGAPCPPPRCYEFSVHHISSQIMMVFSMNCLETLSATFQKILKFAELLQHF